MKYMSELAGARPAGGSFEMLPAAAHVFYYNFHVYISKIKFKISFNEISLSFSEIEAQKRATAASFCFLAASAASCSSFNPAYVTPRYHSFPTVYGTWA